MCDEPVQTLVQTPDGTLDFQDYFVRRRHADRVTSVAFRGIDEAVATQQVVSAIESASAIILCPSNPFVSIGPILAVPGIREALGRSGAAKVAVSPIVGGAAIKGPAAGMMRDFGHEVSPVGVAAIYRGLLDAIVIDMADSRETERIRELGMDVSVADTVMKSDSDREQLAEHVLRVCESLGSRAGAPA